MSEAKRPQIDPEALAAKTLDTIQSLEDVFCHSLEGQAALVTGGASGLGFNIVNRLCQAGAKVMIASRGEARGLKAVEIFRARGFDVSWVQADMTKVADCRKAVDATVETYGRIDVLVANASGWSNYSYLDIEEAEYDRVVDCALKGAYFVGQAAARYMVANKIKGKIVFISSAAHLSEGPANMVMNTHYIAAKSGVVGMTKGIAGELIQYGIHVNCVAPGGMFSAGVFTQGTEAGALYGEEYMKFRSENGRNTPLAMNPDQIALAVFALCTPMADFMVGETVNVNGGVMMNIQRKPFSFTIEGCIPGPSKAE